LPRIVRLRRVPKIAAILSWAFSPRALSRGGQPPQAEFAAAFEQLVDGKVALEDEVAAILDLGDRIEA
jgi:hypothetical protein